jgi:hypothetical protein
MKITHTEDHTMPRVMEVDSIEAAVFKIGSVSFVAVCAIGRVPTTGWSNFELDPYFYLVPPKDGIMDFDFDAKAPTGTVGDVVLPAIACAVFRKPPWLKGVRVHAQSNSQEAPIGKEVPHREAA